MTSPIPFAKHPYPDIDDDADGVLAQQRLATVAGQNFNLVNPYFQRNPYRVTTAASGQAVDLTNPNPNDAAYHAFSGTQWPSVTLTLPLRIAAVVVSISAEVYATTNNAYSFLSYQMIGAGLPGGVNLTDVALAAGSGYAYGTRTTVFFNPTTNLVPGGGVTITPYWYTSGSGDHGFGNGRLDVVCLHAGPQP